MKTIMRSLLILVSVMYLCQNTAEAKIQKFTIEQMIKKSHAIIIAEIINTKTVPIKGLKLCHLEYYLTINVVIAGSINDRKIIVPENDEYFSCNYIHGVKKAVIFLHKWKGEWLMVQGPYGMLEITKKNTVRTNDILLFKKKEMPLRGFIELIKSIKAK